MKKQLFKLMILVPLIFSSCASSKIVEWNTGHITSGYDFSKYSQVGFLFTPLEYNGKYESIGLLQVTFVPKIQRIADSYNTGMFSKAPSYDNKHIISDPSGYKYAVELPNTGYLIDKAYDDAVKMGADAITNLVILNVELTNGPLIIPTVKLSGFAIKRLD